MVASGGCASCSHDAARAPAQCVWRDRASSPRALARRQQALGRRLPGRFGHLPIARRRQRRTPAVVDVLPTVPTFQAASKSGPSCLIRSSICFGRCDLPCRRDLLQELVEVAEDLELAGVGADRLERLDGQTRPRGWRPARRWPRRQPPRRQRESASSWTSRMTYNRRTPPRRATHSSPFTAGVIRAACQPVQRIGRHARDLRLPSARALA